MTATTSPVEEWLKSHNVDFTFEKDVDLDKFNAKASRDNQARFNAIDEQTVLRYAEAMERGEEFPPTVAYKGSDGRLVHIDGNHRFGASELVGKPLPTYIVNTTPETIRLLTYEANTRHGLNPSQEERERHAIFLLDNGVSHEEVRKITGLTKGLVSKAWKLEKGGRRARALGLRGWSKLNRTTQDRISSVANNNVFSEFVRLAARRDLTTIEVEKVARGMKDLATEQEQVKFLKDFDRTIEEEKGKGPGKNRANQTSPRHHAKMHTAFISKMDVDAVVNNVLTAEQRDDLVSQIDSAANVLSTLMDRLSKAKVQS